MNTEERLTDALAEFDQVEPSPDLFDRVERSVALDLAYRRRARWSGGVGLAGVSIVVAFLWLSIGSDGTILGWSVLVAELALLASAVVILGRVIPRFGRIFIADVFRLDPRTGSGFLRLHDVAFLLVAAGYVIGWSWHPQMSGRPDAVEAIRFLLDRIGGLLLLMGALHAVTLVALPVIGLVFGATVRMRARAAAGPTAPPEDPRAVQADRYARLVVWIVGGWVVVLLLVGLGIVVGVGISAG